MNIIKEQRRNKFLEYNYNRMKEFIALNTAARRREFLHRVATVSPSDMETAEDEVGDVIPLIVDSMVPIWRTCSDEEFTSESSTEDSSSVEECRCWFGCKKRTADRLKPIWDSSSEES